MPLPSQVAAFSATWLTLAHLIYALPTIPRQDSSPLKHNAALSKRAIMRGDEYIPLGNTKIPLTPLLLIFAALCVALIGLLYSLLNVLCTSSKFSRNSRIVLEERARAKQDLRVRGMVRNSGPASPSGSPSARPVPPNKIPNKLGGGSRMNKPGLPERVTSRRGYRGTRTSISDARKISDKSHRSSGNSGVGLPLLRNESSSAASSIHLNMDAGKQPLMASATASTPSNSPLLLSPKHLNRNSSVGRGADLYRARTTKPGSIAMNPSSIDPAYASAEARDLHPLETTYQLKRHCTDPSSSRRNSTLSFYESSSSAENSHHGSVTNSRIGSFSMATANPLQPLSPHGFGVATYSNDGAPSHNGSLSPRSPSAAHRIASRSSDGYDDALQLQHEPLMNFKTGRRLQ